MPNIFDPEWDQIRDGEAFARRRSFVGRQAGAERPEVSVCPDSRKTAAYANRGKPHERRELFPQETAVHYGFREPKPE